MFARYVSAHASLTRLCYERAAHCQLNGKDSIGISVADPVAATIESPHIILCDRRAQEVGRDGCPVRHIGGFVVVQGLSW